MDHIAKGVGRIWIEADRGPVQVFEAAPSTQAIIEQADALSKSAFLLPTSDEQIHAWFRGEVVKPTSEYPKEK